MHEQKGNKKLCPIKDLHKGKKERLSNIIQ